MEKSNQRKVVLMLEHTYVSQHALDYAIKNVIRDKDDVMLVSVARTDRETLTHDMEDTVYGKVAEEEDGLATLDTVTEESKALQHAKNYAIKDMLETLSCFAEEVKTAFESCSVHTFVIEDVQDDVGSALVAFLEAHGATEGVIGSSGQHMSNSFVSSVKNALLSWIGMGSVSEYVQQNSPCPVVVVRKDHQLN